MRSSSSLNVSLLFMAFVCSNHCYFARAKSTAHHKRYDTQNLYRKAASNVPRVLWSTDETFPLQSSNQPSSSQSPTMPSHSSLPTNHKDPFYPTHLPSHSSMIRVMKTITPILSTDKKIPSSTPTTNVDTTTRSPTVMIHSSTVPKTKPSILDYSMAYISTPNPTKPTIPFVSEKPTNNPSTGYDSIRRSRSHRPVSMSPSMDPRSQHLSIRDSIQPTEQLSPIKKSSQSSTFSPTNPSYISNQEANTFPPTINSSQYSDHATSTKTGTVVTVERDNADDAGTPEGGENEANTSLNRSRNNMIVSLSSILVSFTCCCGMCMIRCRFKRHWKSDEGNEVQCEQGEMKVQEYNHKHKNQTEFDHYISDEYLPQGGQPEKSMAPEKRSFCSRIYHLFQIPKSRKTRIPTLLEDESQDARMIMLREVIIPVSSTPTPLLPLSLLSPMTPSSVYSSSSPPRPSYYSSYPTVFFSGTISPMIKSEDGEEEILSRSSCWSTASWMKMSDVGDAGFSFSYTDDVTFTMDNHLHDCNISSSSSSGSSSSDGILMSLSILDDSMVLDSNMVQIHQDDDDEGFSAVMLPDDSKSGQDDNDDETVITSNSSNLRRYS